MNWISRYLYFTFGSPKITKVEPITKGSKGERTPNNDSVEVITRAYIARFATWLIALILIISLFAEVLFPFCNRKTPVLFNNAFWACLGYLGGTLIQFMKMDLQKG